MGKLTAVLLLLPGAAGAESVFIDYYGIVDNVASAPSDSGYQVGDAVKGRLVIDLALAPSDLFPQNPTSGSYSYFLESGQPDWITGYSRPNTPQTLDRIFITNNTGDRDGYDQIGLTDGSAPGTAAFRGIELSVGGIEFLSSDRLDQSFHVTKEDRPATFAGSLRWGWAETTKHVGFFLKSLRMTPGRCLAPS